MSIKPENILVLDENIAIKWSDGSESFIVNKNLRDCCPCANCSGESDVFGNVYKNDSASDKADKKQKYLIKGYMYIGHYAIRFVWGDLHSAGIYSFDSLINISD